MQVIKNINFDIKNSNIEIEYVEENKGITFEELCEYCDSIKVDDIDLAVPSESNYKQEAIKSNVLVYITHNKVAAAILHKQQEITYKVKALTTSALKKIFSNNRSYAVPNDRETLILVVCNILSSEEYIAAKAKETFSVTLLDKVEINKLSWQQVKLIRSLYNVKAYTKEAVYNEDNDIIEFKKIISKDSSYSFKEIGDMFKLSHIFARNICLGKVYKDKKS